VLAGIVAKARWPSSAHNLLQDIHPYFS